MRHFLNCIMLALALLVSVPLAGGSRLWAEGEAAEPVDYAAWERAAKSVEAELEESSTTEATLDSKRVELVQWRNRLNTAQTANSARIATVKEQIAALGPVPTDGASEAPEIAAKRQELSDLLRKLQAPGLAAEEAYRRADGLIGEIDRQLRERQADQLLQLWPSPLNPANWAAAAVGVTDTFALIWQEGTVAWSAQRSRTKLNDNLPLILLLLLVAGACTVFARRWIEAFADRIQGSSSGARRQVLALLASTGQVIVPVVGMFAIAWAAQLSDMLGDVTGAIARILPFLGISVFGAIWLGARTFPRQQDDGVLLTLPPEKRAEARFLSAMLGLVVAAEALRQQVMGPLGHADAVTSVASYPIIVAGGVLLWQIGRLLRKSVVESVEKAQAQAALTTSSPGGGATYAQTVVSLLARACMLFGILGPVLASFGYVAAAKAMVFPAILTLALLALLLILQRLLTEVWGVLTRSDSSADREGLVPVLLGFALTLAALPVLALIWGARLSDLTELWTRFGEGFQLGETQISPTDFLVFALLFGIGYMVTRLFQGALRTTILPRTGMDRGGQNALVSGAGYVGIFIAALIAINATGIDLSGLAIVASALSVGIGFGLQNIVQNFVSGIILMIERPVSEGDWISVGTTEGIVKTISVRSTRIQAFDRSMVVVPNADLVSQRVTNFTRFSLAGRLVMPIAVAWGQDTHKIEAVLREVAEAQAMVVLNPPPSVQLTGFASGVLNFEIKAILRDVNFSGQVKNDINHMLVRRFVEEGILLPGSAPATMMLNLPESLTKSLEKSVQDDGQDGGAASADTAEADTAMTPGGPDPLAAAAPAPGSATKAQPRTGAPAAARPVAKPASGAAPSDETT